MSYIDKARELGEALKQTPEVQAILAAEAAIKADPEANEAFIQYQEKESQIVTTQMISKVIPEKDALALIDLKVRLMNKHSLIRTYFQAQQSFERVMAMVNLTITTSIHGMPSADQLPLPDEIKNMAQKVLESIGGGKQSKTLEFPKDMKLPPGLKLPSGLKIPGLSEE
ncbi:MAG TPA: YlbF family regulator [Desulfitobacterium dehalogenans]|uniref:YlbF family regulator n=1 Tax=Desulfitobacterium dehalogenans TaxID=36854 RepID=A0A7C7D6B0_9FIRM|nr:YlbF family regulator [Desulfitobacterium dehalogenans]